MEVVFKITYIGFIVGIIGTGLGGLLAFFISDVQKKSFNFIIGFSGGLMLSIVCFDLLPEAFKLTNLYINIIGMIIGIAMMIYIGEKLCPKTSLHSTSSNKGFMKTGILLAIGVALHNFPEGLAIGSSFQATNSLGIGISIIIALHNIPEGICIAGPMKAGGMNPYKALLFTMLAGLPIGIGTFMGALLGEISKNFIGFCLSLAAGSMLFITLGELIPSSQNMPYKKISIYGVFFGFIMGVILSKNL
ncbi:ZIP family metal transporter [Lutibacter sp. B2]|nr:ZIP family metal transporter [Lutibacter sp. B2]